MRFFITYVLCVLLFAAKAQEQLEGPPAHLLTRFSFRTYSGGVILVRATLNNFKDSLNFILDTGSGGISLDSATHARYGLPLTPSDRIIRGIAGIKQVSFAKNNRLNLPGLTIDSLDFHINDYDLLTSVYGEKIDGIIGYSFLSRYIVAVNFDSARISVYRPGFYKYPKGGHLFRPNILGIPIIGGSVEEESNIASRFFFDSGAGLCLLFSEDFVSDSSLFKKGKRMLDTQAEGVGGKTFMKVTTVKEFKFGPYRLKKVPAFILEDEYNVTNYPYLGGLIGNDLLRRFNYVLNYPKKEIHLIRNKSFLEPFDYSYTGMSLYLIDNLIRVADIMPKSPAEKAGFQEGDIVLAINSDFSGNIQLYKSQLQKADERLRILILRNGKPELKEMKVANILKVR